MNTFSLTSIVISLIFASSVHTNHQLTVQALQSKDSLILTDPVVHVPKILYKPNIVIPKGVRLDSGKVVVFVKATIDTLGKVHNVKVIRSDNRAYNKMALHLAKRYIFESGSIDEKPKPLVIMWPIEFVPTTE